MQQNALIKARSTKSPAEKCKPTGTENVPNNGTGATNAYRLGKIVMGRWEMATWYESPYPIEYSSCTRMYLCEFCLRYFRSAVAYERHCSKCPWRHPPGNEIYRKENLSFWEVDGAKFKVSSPFSILVSSFLTSYTLWFPYKHSSFSSI